MGFFDKLFLTSLIIFILSVVIARLLPKLPGYGDAIHGAVIVLSFIITVFSLIALIWI